MACAPNVEFTEVRKADSGPPVVRCIEPLQDRSWERFVERHPCASLFHSSAWLQALSRTYGYKPIAFTTSPAGCELKNGVVFCQVESWLTGRRLVSLPFSDHCEPLLDSKADVQSLAAALEEEVSRERWRYIEVRPPGRFELPTSLHCSTIRYRLHKLDLSPAIDTLFSNCHKGSTQRKIRRAEREHLVYQEGSTEDLLNCFYDLFKITRKRHNIPPPPRKWFANLMTYLGEALKIRVAFKGDKHIAAIVTIRHKDALVYKYGGCDSGFTNLGSMHFLLWKSIQEAKASGMRTFDLGRSDEDQPGLILFKDRWGACSSSLTYSQYSALQTSQHMFDLSRRDKRSRAAKFVMSYLSPKLLSMIGAGLYSHVG
jgi:Acetyltransferase (GNAT) domain